MFALSVFLRSTILFNSDVSWLLFVTKQLLAGGSYTKDFFEINPPMILYVYSPVILLSQCLRLSRMMVFDIYVYGLTALTLAWVYHFLTRWLINNDQGLKLVVMISVALSLLILPLSDFGQREHLALILTIPYFFSAAAQLNNNKISYYLLVPVGILAAIGFCLKPYFLLSFLLVEIYRYLATKKISCEIYLMAIVILVYAFLLCFVNSDYLTVVLPRISSFYYQSYQARWQALFFNEYAVIFYFIISLYLILINSMSDRKLMSILCIGAIGYYGSYLLQWNVWYYHLYPMIAMGFILGSLLFYFIVNSYQSSWLKIYVYAIVFGTYVLFKSSYVYLIAYYYVYFYFALLAYVMLIALTARQSAWIFSRIMLFVGVFVATIFFRERLTHTILSQHIFILTTCLFLLMMFLLLPLQNLKLRMGYLLQIMLGILLFIPIFYQTGYLYQSYVMYKQLQMPLINYVQHLPGDRVYFFSDSGEFAFPALDYANKTNVSRFGCFAWMPLFKNVNDITEYPVQYAKINNEFYVNAVVEDIKRFHPQYIFVDTRTKGYIGLLQPDYLRFFSLNAIFNDAFKSYKFIVHIENKPLFRFDVYQRNN